MAGNPLAGLSSFGLNTGGGGLSSSSSASGRSRSKFMLGNVGNLVFGNPPTTSGNLVKIGGLLLGAFVLFRLGQK